MRRLHLLSFEIRERELHGIATTDHSTNKDEGFELIEKCQAYLEQKTNWDAERASLLLKKLNSDFSLEKSHIETQQKQQNLYSQKFLLNWESV